MGVSGSTTLSSDHVSGTPGRNRPGTLSAHGASQGYLFAECRVITLEARARSARDLKGPKSALCLSSICLYSLPGAPRAHVSAGTKRSEAPSAVKGRQS
jgi:hypothetical protein